ncbi:TSUP family transporter [Secundilactobacillus kimchicus]|uniref:sulfite exporter TauE/SafE family protein n=1 Tax=Secundilactobacillus kimchicus TaxID=528209 RepID=UPI001C00AE64|nr:sulfite exporter TauE/SafE family protein [Secundilactobacillus kimchicus]MBT9671367.1 TSUP family transporter [Secundilactobacillus kimchicus]
MGTIVFVFFAGVAAGLLASTAGLASVVSYPALLAVGLPPVLANVTNTAALIFSGLGAITASIKELRGHWRRVSLFVVLSLLGSVGGSWLLLAAPAESFEKVVPFFILTAALMLLISGRQTSSTTDSLRAARQHPNKRFLVLLASYLGVILVGAYTGYFGAAGGVLFLALLSVILDDEFAVINAIKNVMAFAGNFVATIIFIFRSHIVWHFVIVMGVGLFIGGYLGPVIVRHVNIKLLRALIALAAMVLAVDLFIKAYLK